MDSPRLGVSLRSPIVPAAGKVIPGARTALPNSPAPTRILCYPASESVLSETWSNGGGLAFLAWMQPRHRARRRGQRQPPGDGPGM
jgi:hypothetical protein